VSVQNKLVLDRIIYSAPKKITISPFAILHL